MKKNLILIGMSGAGKSTLGVLLAKALGMSFTDTDIVIQEHEKCLLQHIIDSEGADRFLSLEEEIVSSFSAQNSVIATGGSVVYSEKAMNTLKQNGVTVYLQVSTDCLKKRLADITTRGIVFKHGGGLDELLCERIPLYEKYADLTVDCTDKSVEYCVNKIVEAAKNGLLN